MKLIAIRQFVLNILCLIKPLSSDGAFDKGKFKCLKIKKEEDNNTKNKQFPHK
jgi:hypothetical protein